MWQVVEETQEYTLRYDGETFERKSKDGTLIRWIPVDAGIKTPNGRLVNYLPPMGVKTLCVPDTFFEIGYGAFAFLEEDNGEFSYVPNCLKKIKLGKELIKIDNGAFAFLQLDEIELDVDNRAAKLVDGGILSKDGKRYLYKFDEYLVDQDYFVPDGVEVIGDDAFCACDRKVVLPRSVKRIGSGAFPLSYAEVVLPRQVKKIAPDAFHNSAMLWVKRFSAAHRFAIKNKIKRKFY